jgi:hypothetical protein
MDRLCPCPKAAQQARKSTTAVADRKYRMKSPEANAAPCIVHIDLGIYCNKWKSGLPPFTLVKSLVHTVVLLTDVALDHCWLGRNPIVTPEEWLLLSYHVFEMRILAGGFDELCVRQYVHL